MILAGQLDFQEIEGPVAAVSEVGGVEQLVTTAIGFITIAGFVTFVIWFIIGAYGWITSAGHAEKLEKARNHITNAITGVLVLVAGFAFAAVIAKLLGIDFLFNLTQEIQNLKIK